MAGRRAVPAEMDDDADLGAVRSDLAEAVATYPVVDLKDQEEFDRFMQDYRSRTGGNGEAGEATA